MATGDAAAVAFEGVRTLGAPDAVRSMLLRRGEGDAFRGDAVSAAPGARISRTPRGSDAWLRLGPGGSYRAAAMSSTSLCTELPPIFCPCIVAKRLRSSLSWRSSTPYISFASSILPPSFPPSTASRTLSMSRLATSSSELPVFVGKSSSTMAAKCAGSSMDLTHTACRILTQMSATSCEVCAVSGESLSIILHTCAETSPSPSTTSLSRTQTSLCSTRAGRCAFLSQIENKSVRTFRPRMPSAATCSTAHVAAIA